MPDVIGDLTPRGPADTAARVEAGRVIADALVEHGTAAPRGRVRYGDARALCRVITERLADAGLLDAPSRPTPADGPREAAALARLDRSWHRQIERALKEADAPEDSMATDEDQLRYVGRHEAVEIVREMLELDGPPLHVDARDTTEGESR